MGGGGENSEGYSPVQQNRTMGTNNKSKKTTLSQKSLAFLVPIMLKNFCYLLCCQIVTEWVKYHIILKLRGPGGPICLIKEIDFMVFSEREE